MVIKEVTRFGAKEVRQYHEKGYYFPVTVLAEEEILTFKGKFLNLLAETAEQREKLSSRDQYLVFSETHTYLNWVYRMVLHPNVLDAVEAILGPNLMVWGSRWFSKMPGEKTYVSWHQDATYWGLRPPNVTTAWIALSDSIPENGGMRVIPGTHRGELLPQTETYAPENALSRGQEIAVEVDESQAIDLTLGPGEMSFHHIGIVHGSNVNNSDRPRIGIAVRYIAPDVAQDGPERSLAMLARGRDNFGHFEMLEPPQTDALPAPGQSPKAIERMMKSIMPRARQPSPR